MIAAPDTTLMRTASRLIAERTGLHFPEERWSQLSRTLEVAAKELGFDSLEACVGSLASGGLRPRDIDAMASHLTVGETYFFRDPASFAALEQEILPRLVARRFAGTRTLRLWSAACCTGEEAYSLAISCARALPDIWAWNVSILATDINPRFLAKGEAGVYSERSFRGAPAWLRPQFFSPADHGKLAINTGIKKLVQFDRLNLATDIYPALHNHTNAMDVIFCRNVLMYFTPEHQRKVVGALHRCLVDGGYLVVSAAEASASLFPMFEIENVDDAILCRKAARGARTELPRHGISPATPSAAASTVVVPEYAVAMTRPPPVALSAPVAPASVLSAGAAQDLVDLVARTRNLADRGLLDEALASCQEAIVARRTDPAAQFLCAEIYHELGRFEEATVALRNALFLDQGFILAHYALAEVHRRCGRKRESRRHFATALELLLTKGRDEVVPESNGMTCGRLAELILTVMEA